MTSDFCKHQELRVGEIIEKLYAQYQTKGLAVSKEETTKFVLDRTPAEILIMVGLLF